MIEEISKKVINELNSKSTFELVFQFLFMLFRGRNRIIRDFRETFFNCLERMNYREYLNIHYRDRVIMSFDKRYKEKVNTIIK